MEITADFSQVEAMEARLMRVQGGLPKAMERALNRTGQGTVALTSQALRAQYTTIAKPIKERLWLTKASARQGVYESRVDPRREGYKRLSLIYFTGVRPTSITTGKARPRQGIRVRVRKDGSGGYLPHSFVAPQRNIKTGDLMGPAIFQRKTKHGKRTPLVKMLGPSVASQMKNTKARARIIPETQKRLNTRLVHEAAQVLREAGLLS
jgi:hypothetical protein